MEIMKNKAGRIHSLDLLRGIAVLLMVQQHTGFWFWNEGGAMGSLLHKYPVMVTINGLGGLAAPLFIILAGAGTALSLNSGRSGRQIFRRGLVLILFGYILNILTPAWFSPRSWYVLHLIGFGICVSPLLHKKNSFILFTAAAAIVVISVFLLYHFKMPRYFSNEFMRGEPGFAGFMKLALFTGHFPVFPWITLYMAGIISGRWISEGAYGRILKCAALVFSSAVLLYLVKQGNFAFMNNAFGKRLLIINLYMYPAYPVQFLTLTAASLLMLCTALYTGGKFKITSSNILVLTGRASLTIFILHIVIIRNFMVKSGLWQTFSEPLTVTLQISIIALILLLVYLWNKKDFRYGFEWILRRIT